MHQRLLEHLTTAVVLLDAQLSVRWLNPAAEALMGLSLSRVQGTSLECLEGEEGRIAAMLADALRRQHPYTQRETQLTMASGERITVDYTATPLSKTELLLEFERRELQQTYRLLQLWGHRQLLAEPELQTLLHILISIPLRQISGVSTFKDRKPQLKTESLA